MIDQQIQQLQQEGSVTIAVRVRPNASTSAVKGIMADGTLKIDLHAPAEDGKANVELIRFLAEMCELDRSNIQLVSGQTNRQKMVKITR